MIPDMSKVPKLYSQEKAGIENTIIYQKWIHPFAPGFYWLISEYDPIEQMAFGYANLNDDQNAEWGYIYLPEIIEAGACIEKSFESQKFTSIIHSLNNQI
ncbi:MAG: hypothetical protein JNL74_21435 [Fibrobacteres bacterium]|nr:hypothetical protein [Fibrobacterota bacterium]